MGWLINSVFTSPRKVKIQKFEFNLHFALQSHDLQVKNIFNKQLTNSMAYGTRRINVAFTRALQQFVS